ncbi:MAG TPA: hypothetical protein DCE18_12870 [Syntrophobacteraceae bacterium]|nr:hypothetical protein [Syntrophobacteraceae bacterium]
MQSYWSRKRKGRSMEERPKKAPWPKWLKISIQVLIILLIVPIAFFSRFLFVGPYSGQVIDGETGKPLAGASVLIGWEVYTRRPLFRDLGVVRVELLTTDEHGRYQVPRMFMDPRPLMRSLTTGEGSGFLSVFNLVERTFLFASLPSSFLALRTFIYHFGYQFQGIRSPDQEDGSPAHVDTSHTVVKLDRIPPYLDHEKHVGLIESMTESLLARESTRLRQKPDASGEESRNRQMVKKFLAQVEWEKRRVANYSHLGGKQIPFDPNLARDLREGDVQTRRKTARALADCVDAQTLASPVLIESLNDSDPSVKLEAIYSLGQISIASPKTLNALAAVIETDLEWPHPLVQQEALIAITKRARSPLRALVKPPDGEQYQKAWPEAVARLVAVLLRKFNDEYLKAEIIPAFRLFRVVEAVDALEAASHHPEQRIRTLALDALGELAGLRKAQTLDGSGAADPVPALIQALGDPSPEVRVKAIVGLGRVGDSRSVDAILQAAQDSDKRVQLKAIETLANFNEVKILPVLATLLGAQEAAANSFLAVASRTTDEKSYSYRKEGKIIVTREDPEPSFRKEGSSVNYQELQLRIRLVHHQAVTHLENALKSPDAKIRVGALGLLCNFADPRIRENVVGLLKEPSATVREAAVAVLGCDPDDAAVGPIQAALQDPVRRGRRGS